VATKHSLLRVKVSWYRTTATVDVSGELNHATAAGLILAVLELAIAARPQRFVLNLADVVVLDVVGAKALDQARHTLGTRCPVAICNPRPSAREMFRLAGIAGWEEPVAATGTGRPDRPGRPALPSSAPHGQLTGQVLPRRQPIAPPVPAREFAG